MQTTSIIPWGKFLGCVSEPSQVFHLNLIFISSHTIKQAVLI